MKSNKTKTKDKNQDKKTWNHIIYIYCVKKSKQERHESPPTNPSYVQVRWNGKNCLLH